MMQRFIYQWICRDFLPIDTASILLSLKWQVWSSVIVSTIQFQSQFSINLHIAGRKYPFIFLQSLSVCIQSCIGLDLNFKGKLAYRGRGRWWMGWGATAAAEVIQASSCCPLLPSLIHCPFHSLHICTHTFMLCTVNWANVCILCVCQSHW